MRTPAHVHGKKRERNRFSMLSHAYVFPFSAADRKPKRLHNLNQKRLLATLLTRAMESAQGGPYSAGTLLPNNVHVRCSFSLSGLGTIELADA
jgi:hypothetical protein